MERREVTGTKDCWDSNSFFFSSLLLGDPDASSLHKAM